MKESKNKPVKKSMFNKVKFTIKDLVCILFWLQLVATRYDIFKSLDDDIRFLYKYTPIILTLIFIMYFIINIISRKKITIAFFMTLLFIAKLLFYPFVLIIYIFVILYYLLKLFNHVTKLSRMTVIHIMTLIIWVTSLYLILSREAIFAVIIGDIAMFISILFLWMSLLIWTIKPLPVLNRLSDLLKRLWKWLYKNNFENNNATTKSQTAAKKLISTLIGWRDIWVGLIKWTSSIINSNALKTRLMIFFLGIYCIVLLLSILGFASIYYGIVYLYPMSFQIYDLTFFDCFYASAMMTFTLSPIGFVAVNTIAKIIVLLQGISSFYFFVILLLTYTTVAEEAVREHIKKIVEQLEDYKLDIESVFENNFDIPLEEFRKIKKLEELYNQDRKIIEFKQ